MSVDRTSSRECATNQSARCQRDAIIEGVTGQADAPTTVTTARREFHENAKGLVVGTREEWLLAAVRLLTDEVLAPHGIVLHERPQVSTGWPRSRRHVGVCHTTAQAADGRNHIFISPILAEEIDVVAVLLHELLHAADDCKSGHRGQFARWASAVGLDGPMTSTTPGPALSARLNAFVASLGAYPHGALANRRAAAQTTRMVKLTCPHCGYLVRTTRSWLDRLGHPLCPAGFEMTRS